MSKGDPVGYINRQWPPPLTQWGKRDVLGPGLRGCDLRELRRYAEFNAKYHSPLDPLWRSSHPCDENLRRGVVVRRL